MNDASAQAIGAPSLAPGDGTEHGHPMGSALPRDAQDLRAVVAQPLQCQHVIGHLYGIAA